jgi:hypothetical protein
MTGYTSAEVVGRNVSMFYTPEDIAAGKLTREFEMTLCDGRFDDEGWRVRKDGTRSGPALLSLPCGTPTETFADMAE